VAAGLQEARAAETGVAEQGTREYRAIEAAVLRPDIQKLGACEVRPGEIGLVQPRVLDARPGQVGTVKHGPAEIQGRGLAPRYHPCPQIRAFEPCARERRGRVTLLGGDKGVA